MGFFIALLLAMVFFGFTIFGFKRFDAMIHRIYDTDKERWQSLGRPMGYFGVPKDKTPFFRSTFSRDVLFFQFLAGGMKAKDRPTESGQTTAILPRPSPPQTLLSDFKLGKER